MQPSRQPEPHQEHGDRQQQELRHDDAADDLVGQRIAPLQRFRHLDQDRSGLLALLGPRLGDPGIGDPPVLAAMRQGPALDQADLRKVVDPRPRQGRITRQNRAGRRKDLVGGALLALGGQQAPGHVEALRRLQAAGDLDVVGERADPLLELAIEGHVGERACDDEREHHGKRPQQRERREHEIEDFGIERAPLVRLALLSGGAWLAPALDPVRPVDRRLMRPKEIRDDRGQSRVQRRTSHRRRFGRGIYAASSDWAGRCRQYPRPRTVLMTTSLSSIFLRRRCT